jgi:MoaA/NifB/PqqE/SkfB family radical SAM enzyme
MDAARFADYDKGRNFANKAVRALCYAPHTNLFFDRLGSVRVCCWNWSHAAGNITETSLDEMWHGAQVAALRAALNGYQYAPGCDFCQFQAAEGWFGGAKMRNFDRFEVISPDPQWPQQMEFSISNACNLECIMCDGEHSSAIRAQREKRPAMARLYTDEILETFRKYLPHLNQAKFLGGEPFLVTEHYKIWDMMIEDGLKTLCHVTTNGTQYNERVERMLAQLPFGFAISLDGASKSTIERVRVNTNYEELMRNTRRFRNYARAAKTPFSLTYCLMRPNWQELGDFCLMADDWDCPVGINTVLHPQPLSLYSLPVEELRKILAVMEKQAARLDSQLRRNKAVWFDEFERIRRKCAAVQTAQAAPPAPRKEPARNAFFLAITGERQIDEVSPALHFLKKFSKAEVIVLHTRSERRVAHDAVFEIALPSEWDDRRAAMYLKTHALEYMQDIAEEFCYLDSSVMTLAQGVDEVFAAPDAPLRFAAGTQSIDSLSRSAVNCHCLEANCNHLREAILCAFGTDIAQCDWKPPESRMFLFTAEAAPFLQAWYNNYLKIAHDPYWKNPELGALIATLWQFNLAGQNALSHACVRLVAAA